MKNVVRFQVASAPKSKTKTSDGLLFLTSDAVSIKENIASSISVCYV